jgi:CopG antitoxin of type II toxin-antitoxin system
MTKTIDVEEFDRKFDAGESILGYLDWSSFRRPGLEVKRVNLDMPQHMVAKLDTHARNRGVTRQALIKMWLADRLEVAV